MSDTIDNLKEAADHLESRFPGTSKTMRDAADTIEALRRTNAELLEALTVLEHHAGSMLAVCISHNQDVTEYYKAIDAATAAIKKASSPATE